jgi:UDP-N-acetylglucosamine 1-carboxyvinyltransferase
VWDVFHIDRGYPKFVENMNKLGADVTRVAAPPERD